MKKKFKFLFMGLLIVFITGCGNSNVITEIDYTKLENMIDNKENFILEVIQTGCSHCQEFSPRFKAILKTNNIKAYSLNLYNLTEEEKDKFEELTTISGTPTVLFFEDGKETNNRIYGAVSNDKIEEHLKEGKYIK